MGARTLIEPEFGTTNVSSAHYKISQNENIFKKHSNRSGRIKIIFKDHNEAVADAEKEAREKNLPKEKVREFIENIPKSGFVYVLIYRTSRDGAKLDNFSYIVKQKKKEQLDFEGGMWGWRVSDTPGLPSREGENGHYWTNLDMIRIEDPIDSSTPISILIVDKMGGKDTFTIAPKAALPKQGTSFQ